jgi:fermentation-respiration switch protein FrsA (DUF1100 family)
MVIARIAVWVLTAYVTVGAYFWLMQSKLLFPAPENQVAVRPDIAGFEDLRIGGVHAWWVPAPATIAKTAVVFHGNGYTIEDMVGAELDQLRALGVNLLLIDYRGYGLSAKASPSEATIFADVDASFNYLLRQRGIAEQDLFVIGRSIGSGPAVYLASKHAHLAGLILESPFTSIDDAAGGIWYLRIYPVGLMLRSHFDNASRIGSVHAPVLMTVGSEDELTPPWMAGKLYGAAHEPKKLVIVNRAGHNDLIETGGPQLRDTLRQWLTRDQD